MQARSNVTRTEFIGLPYLGTYTTVGTGHIYVNIYTYISVDTQAYAMHYGIWDSQSS